MSLSESQQPAVFQLQQIMKCWNMIFIQNGSAHE